MNVEMNLKLLGDLQVYDMPYLSLYTDKTTHLFYLAFRISSQFGPESEYVVAPVSVEHLLLYLKGQTTVRGLFKESGILYRWQKKRGVKGGLSLTCDREIESRIDNSVFNPLLCNDEEVILEYILENK